MTAPHPLPSFVAVSSSGVDAAGRHTSPPPVTCQAADAASRRQHRPADVVTRLAGVAPASTHYFAVVAYLHAALPHTWRPDKEQLS